MQHKTQEQLQCVAAVYPENETRPAMTRSERLERRADLLRSRAWPAPQNAVRHRIPVCRRTR